MKEYKNYLFEYHRKEGVWTFSVRALCFEDAMKRMEPLEKIIYQSSRRTLAPVDRPFLKSLASCVKTLWDRCS